MARTTADFSLREHAHVETWNTRHPFGLSARTVLNHPLAEEVIVVFRLEKDVPLWHIVPLQGGKVTLKCGPEVGGGLIMRMTGHALKMIEIFECETA